VSDPSFALNLGNGIYIDSNGDILNTPPPSIPVYKAPFSFPVDANKIANALSSTKSALSTLNKDSFLQERWGKVAGFDKLLDVLTGVGKLAGYLAPVATVFSFAIDLAKLLDVLKEGPSPLEQLVSQRFDQLDLEIAAGAKLTHIQKVSEDRVAAENLVDAVHSYSNYLKHNNPDPAQLEADRTALTATYQTHIDGLSLLFDSNTWLALFQRNQYTYVWPLIVNVLFAVPGVPATPDAPEPYSPTEFLPVPVPQGGEPVFDHRLMVPLVSFAAEALLTSMRGIEPEYRTTGRFQDALHRFAGKIEALSQAMRMQGLARTVYRPDHFSQQLRPQLDVVTFGPFGPDPTISPKCSFWPVGALDLRYHDDTHFRDFIGQLTENEMTGVSGPTKLGTIDLRWIPPAVLAPKDGGFIITNPVECATAANAQAEQDYANLLAVSGYTELRRLATLLRNEAAEPVTSQTVHGEPVQRYRNPLAATSVTVQSNPIRFTGQIITSPATRQPQDCMDTVTVWTQPIKRSRPIQYRVRLRTLNNSYISKDSWDNLDYSAYQFVSYEPDPDNPGFLRLNIKKAYLEVASEPLIPDWTPSPPSPNDSIHRPGSVDMLADTFDWWIPVDPPFTDHLPFRDIAALLHGLGWPQGKLPVGHHFPGPPEKQNVELFRHTSHGPFHGPFVLRQPDDKEKLDGQRRDVRKETVHIEYQLNWTADELQFSIRNRPTDRSYVVFLVIEEKMQGSDNILDTAVALPVNGLITYVPRKFFDDEFTAQAQAASVIAGQVGALIPSGHEIGPPDPSVAWATPGNLATLSGVNHFLDLAKQHRPALFQSIIESLKSKSAGSR
jgi:hypothetical protein